MKHIVDIVQTLIPEILYGTNKMTSKNQINKYHTTRSVLSIKPRRIVICRASTPPWPNVKEVTKYSKAGGGGVLQAPRD